MSNIHFIRNGSNSATLLSQAVTAHQYKHPIYLDYEELYEKISDVLEGEEAVKAKGKVYLPDISVGDKCFDAEKYNDYKQRAVFTPYASRTVEGFVGTIFRRSVQVEMKNKTFKVDKMTRDPFQIFARKLGKNLFEKGRAGVFTNFKEKKGIAESTIYCAEDIMSWEEDDDGNLIYVFLRDIKQEIARPNKKGSTNKLYYGYKSLQLIDGVYSVTYYDSDMEIDRTVVPLNKTREIDYIPFVFFGVEENNSDVDRPPILNIVNLNIAHYHTSGLLETGRRYTAFPIYTVPVGNKQEETSAYTISPSVVWETPLDSKPAILEYYGQGLNHLAEALSEKERAIIQLGARAIGLRDIESRYEASSIFQLLYQAELALLTNVTDLLSDGLQTVIWQNMNLSNVSNVPERDDILVSVSKEFKTSNLAAGDIRAVALLAEQGLLPLQDVYTVLKSAELVGGDVTFEQFKLLLDAEKKQTDTDFQRETTITAEEPEKAKKKFAIPKDPATQPQPGGPKKPTPDGRNSSGGQRNEGRRNTGN